MTEQGRLAAGSEEPRNGDAVAGRAPDGLDRVIDMLEAVVRVLPVLVPDPADGSAWVQFDEATSDLHRALTALGQIDAAAGERAVAAPPTAAESAASPA